MLPITNIEGVINGNNFSLLLNVIYRLPINIFSQNKITKIHTNTSLIMDVVMEFISEETNVGIMEISNHKKKIK